MITVEHIIEVQRELHDDDYGAALAADGNWTDAWQREYERAITNATGAPAHE